MAQKTEDLVGPYELLISSFIMFFSGFRPSKIYWMAQNAFRGVYTDDVILHWLRLFYRRFSHSSLSVRAYLTDQGGRREPFSPRGDWRMPSDAMSTNWLKELEELS